MASTKERLTQLADEHLDLGSGPDFDAQLADAGVSSVAAVAFFKKVNEAFNLSLQAEDCLQFRTLGILAAYVVVRHAGGVCAPNKSGDRAWRIAET